MRRIGCTENRPPSTLRVGRGAFASQRIEESLRKRWPRSPPTNAQSAEVSQRGRFAVHGEKRGVKQRGHGVFLFAADYEHVLHPNTGKSS